MNHKQQVNQIVWVINMKWDIDKHRGSDKFFEMGNNSICMKVDYDDVNHPEVDAAAKYIKTLLENFWEDRVFSEYYKNELEKQWEEDKWLQEEYPEVDKYVLSRV